MSIQIPSDIRLSGEPGYCSNDISLPLSASTLLPCSSFLLHFFGWREEKREQAPGPGRPVCAANLFGGKGRQDQGWRKAPAGSKVNTMTAYMDRKDLTNRDIPAERRRQITDNVRRVLDTIAAAEQQSGRQEGAVRLLAAVKTRDAGEIMAAVDAGVHMIGENRPQEAVAVGGILAEEFSRRGPLSLSILSASCKAIRLIKYFPMWIR